MLALVSYYNLFIMQMDDLKEKTADLADHAEDLANTFYRLSVIKITEKTTNIASGIIMAIAIGLFGFFIVLFMGVALAWWLGDLVNSRTGGFLLAAGFFLIVLLVIALIRKKIIFPYIRNRIIRKIYE